MRFLFGFFSGGAGGVLLNIWIPGYVGGEKGGDFDCWHFPYFLFFIIYIYFFALD
ncbi:hypothetical protein F5X96DRAFT_625059 [Biscogniauxia mediterranea]|nr:hypothetical protein F5X96DRAFT_625059 [Biscogniauxia mediterranea]